MFGLKSKLVSGAVLAVMAACVVAHGYYMRTELKEARTALQKAESRVSTLERRIGAQIASVEHTEAIKAGIKEEYANEQRKTEEALAEVPDWGNAAVPDAILRSLRAEGS